MGKEAVIGCLPIPNLTAGRYYRTPNTRFAPSFGLRLDLNPRLLFPLAFQDLTC